MRTTKPIATISYNSPAYLKQKLTELQRAGKISFWAFISHLPEDDEAGLKNHNHLYIEPSKIIQTEDLRAEFKEFDPSKPDKPLGCISFRNSNFDNWYMYSIHDKAYLASKGQSRKYHYSIDDVVSSDFDDLQFNVRTINLIHLSPYRDMLEAINNGLSWSDYFARGTIPIQQIRQWEYAWSTLISTATNRNGRDNHNDEAKEYEVDEATGEVLNVR